MKAKIIATNFYGDSAESLEGDGGENARIVLVPDAPFDLTNSQADTNAFQVSFTWLEGLNNGGKPVDFYEISYDQGRGVFVVLEETWNTGTSYTTDAGLVS